MTSCELPRPVTLTDTPHPQLGEFGQQRDLIASLDLVQCNVAYITMALNEFELTGLRDGSIGHRFESWPADIRARMERQIAEWIARNPGVAVKGFTQGVNAGCCVMAIHWRPKQ